MGPDAAPDATTDASGETSTRNARSDDLSQQRMQGDTDETINTPADFEVVLGDRQMNSDVPNVCCLHQPAPHFKADAASSMSKIDQS